ncbi:MAG: MXAN_5187 C-terminal domain-containing protein [Myxococcota bacterium]
MATRTQRDEGTSPDIRATLDELEEGIEALRLAYEKYFSGIDRVPPSRQRSKLERMMRSVELRGITNTVVRFRMNGLRARFITYKHYWTRVENQMERGMSRRDLLKRRRGVPKPPPEPKPDLKTDPKTEAEPEADAAAPGGPPPPPRGPLRRGRPKPADPASAGIDPAHLRDVFKELVKAKRAAGESTQGLTYQALVRKLTKEAPKLKQKHGCEKLQFSVSTRGGKVRLRSGPKSSAP